MKRLRQCHRKSQPQVCLRVQLQKSQGVWRFLRLRNVPLCSIDQAWKWTGDGAVKGIQPEENTMRAIANQVFPIIIAASTSGLIFAVTLL
jgi:hypothetical protein